MADDTVVVDGDERHGRPAVVAQAIDKVRLGGGREGSLVHAVDGRGVAGLLGADRHHGRTYASIISGGAGSGFPLTLMVFSPMAFRQTVKRV
ncbi:hypothetical protein D3C83_37320 [compost metagenome]